MVAEIVPPEEYWWMLFRYYLIAATLIGGSVAALLLYFMRKYKAESEDEEGEDYPGPGRVAGMAGKVGATRYTLLITGIIVMGLTIATFPYTEYVESSPENVDLTIWVTGFRFGWKFEYPPPYNITTIGEVVVPTDSVVEFKVTSQDVFHAFGIPDMEGVKIDAIPGIMNTVWITTPSEPGEYDIWCYELCGVGHSLMTAKLKVVTPEEFKAWIEEKQG